DELRVGAGAGLRALEHDRAERARGDNGVGAGRLQLLEAHVADARARLLFLVGEQQPAAGAAAVRVVAVALGLGDDAPEPRDERARLVDLAGVAAQITRIVERDPAFAH